jgi:hypothetical protein
VAAPAQITITQSDMPVLGKTIESALDTVPGVTPGSAGTNQTWSFGSLKTQTTILDTFVLPSHTLYDSSFLTSGIADSTLGTEGYTYYVSNSSAYSSTGFVADYVVYLGIIPYNTPFIQISFPAVYGDNSGGISSGYDAIPIMYASYDSARATTQITYRDTIDAWGSMTTPAGTFSVLRQKHFELDVDSLFLYNGLVKVWGLYEAKTTKNYQYRWYAKGINFLLADMQMDTNNAKPTRVQWFIANVTGINTVTQHAYINAYPNPCDNMVSISSSCSLPSVLTVFDVTGRLVSTLMMNNGKQFINTSKLPEGIYLFRVCTETGDFVNEGKFTVIH